jgi:hypothetical protein
LGAEYIYYCNPSVFSHRLYLPVILKSDTPLAGQASSSAGLFTSPLPATDLFASPLPLPTDSARHLIDDFEYLDAPTNHGWYSPDADASLVTMNYKFDSLKLHATVKTKGHEISVTYPGDPDSGQRLALPHPFLSFEVGDVDGWRVAVEAQTEGGEKCVLYYEPRFGVPSLERQDGQIVARYSLGEGYLSGKFHDVGRDLAEDLHALAPDLHLATVERLTFQGLEYLDDVVLQEPPFPGDKMAPTTTLHLAGTLSHTGWYTSPVKFSISAADETNGSGVATTFRRFDHKPWRANCGYTSTLEAEGRHLLEGYAVDRAGNVEGVKSASFGVDRTPPAVEIVEPAATACVQGDALTVSWQAEDTASGVASVVATLDGEAIDPGQDTLETWMLSPGPHTLAVTVTDAAGWSAHDSQVFTITVTLRSLARLAQHLQDTDQFDGPDAGGVVARIGAQLDQAQATLDEGDVGGAAQQLESLIAEVKALTGAQITPAGSALLIEGIEYFASEAQTHSATSHQS